MNRAPAPTPAAVAALLVASLWLVVPALRAESRSSGHFKKGSLEAHVVFLASDELEGRGNGTTGLELAAAYIAGQFETLGLAPMGDENTYFQRFQVASGHRLASAPRASLVVSGTKALLSPGEDFEPLTFSPPGTVSGSVVFAGYGVTAREHDYDDYEGIDVTGKIVLLLRHAPGEFDDQGWHATFVRKARNAHEHGAVGAIIVNGTRRRKDTLVPFGADVGAERMPIPVIHVKREPVEKMLGPSGTTLETLQRSIDENLGPASFPLPDVQLTIAIDVERTAADVENVLGYLPPTARDRERDGIGDEHIIIGAHYDHVGFGEEGSRDHRARGKVHNGADDNASGVAGLLEMARAFSTMESRKRGVLFAAFAGEEIGLRGSNHYTSNPVLPLSNAVVMFNLDMIGRLRHDRIFLGGLDTVPEIQRLIDRYMEEAGLTVSQRFSAADASDHAPFIRAGVPALFFFTGLHGDYHKPTDDPQFISYEGMERVLDVGYRLADHIVQAEETALSSYRQARMHRGTTPYFGVGVDNAFVGDGLRVSYVAEDGPAARAGLVAGDVLLEIGGRPVTSSERAAIILQGFSPGDVVEARVRRGGAVLEMKVTIANWP